MPDYFGYDIQKFKDNRFLYTGGRECAVPTCPLYFDGAVGEVARKKRTKDTDNFLCHRSES
jgi:hypothetical protein